MLPKLNSAHGSETRNIINRAIEMLNRLGIDVQTLVAEGQLTPSQYAELIREVNGLIAKGEVKLDDLSPEILEAINNGSGTPFEILSIPRDGSVSPEKTTFLKKTSNLFNGEYLPYVLVTMADGGMRIRETLTGEVGGLAIIPVSPNTQYTVKSHDVDLTDAFRIGLSNRPFELSIYGIYDLDTVILQRGSNAPEREYTFTTGEGSQLAFIYVSKTGKSPRIQVQRGSSADDYQPPYILDKQFGGGNEIKPESIKTSHLKDGIVIPEKTSFFKFSHNLFDLGKATLDYYLDYGYDQLKYFEGYVTSDYIPINENQDIHFNMVFSVAFYDVNKNYISSVQNSPQTAKYYTAPEDGFVRYSFRDDYMNPGEAQAEYGTTETPYEPHVQFKREYLPQMPGGEYSGKLHNKKLLNIGDSIASATTPGVDGYHEIIRDKYSMDVTSLAVGGATFTVVDIEGRVNIISQVNQAVSEGLEFDYILIGCGTNDANLDSSLFGTISDGYDAVLDTSTFCGGFEYTLKTLRLNWLGAKIIYIRPHNMASRDERQITLGNLAIEMCEKCSIPYVDLYKEGGLNTQIPEMIGTYTIGDADRTHPNTAGYETFYAPAIESKMKSV